MKAIGAFAALAVATGAAAQANPDHDKLVKAACGKGNPWRMPLPAGGLKNMEAPVKLYGADGKSMLVCNCTADLQGKATGVWVESDDFSERAAVEVKRAPAGRGAVGSGKPRFAHYLPGGSCTVAASGTVALKPADTALETWGTFDAFDAK
jgi:hypothetical protein